MLQHTCTGHRAAIYALAHGQSEHHVLSAGGDGWIVEWNLDEPETGRVVASVETQIFSLIAFPEKKQLVAGNMNGGLHWVDLVNPEKTRNVQHHQKGVYDLQRHGPWLFSAGGEGILTRWALEEARSVESFHLSNKALRAIAVSPGRSEMAVGASDGSIYFLDLETLALKHTLEQAHHPSVFALCYSPDGRCLLSGGRDAMLRVWDLGENDAPILHTEQPAHWFTINHIVYAPDGSRFATAGRDKTIKIWDSSTFRLLQVLDMLRDGGHVNSVNHLLWLPDALLSGSDDRTVKIWNPLG
ncbi:MAG: WD40 repeat domain-containing protein [Lewinellaceae bacterium]|nr:WD40 repeat domain-containing protein [Lewinellaceae bacterium]